MFRFFFGTLRLLAIVMVVGTAGYLWLSTTPEWTLFQVGSAIASRNMQQFDEYVDMNAVVDSQLGQYITEQAKSAPIGKLGQEFTKAAAAMMKPLMAKVATMRLQSMVTEGKFLPASGAQADALANPVEWIKALVFKQAAGIKLTGPIFVKDACQFTLAFKPETPPMVIQLQQQQGKWVVTSLKQEQSSTVSPTLSLSKP